MVTHSLQFNRSLVGAVLVSASDSVGLENRSPHNSAGQSTNQSPPRSPEIQKLLTRISTSVDQLQTRHSEYLQQLNTTSVQLALLIVEKLIGSSQPIQAQRLENLLEEALHRSEPAVGIHVHPQDIAELQSFTASESSGHQLNLVADPSVEKGECRVKYATYELTSSLAQQIEEIEHRLLEVIHEQ